MIPIKLPSMNKKEIDEAIHKQYLCRIAFNGKDGPQIAPFQYVFIDNHLYFHFTNYGDKIGFINQEKPVCVEIENYAPDFSEYSFVILNGNLKTVQDSEEKRKVIEKMSETGKEKLSTHFLFAHGFDSEAGWSILNENQDMLIVKLYKVKTQKGLKSPKQ
ncbi:MAG: pyridoxamine 5'-phosphate oxidase family protein [Candidatus Bathyarchaeia archaeon]|jgi:nitroimidazol reductase NimA-like FMN-containing flavoprotein (pyridoxamine 5'-phosphate oxidase superfamily)